MTHTVVRQLGSLVIGLALVFPAKAGDLVVNPAKPGAYQTLQAALDAAQPGDRILLETDLPFAAAGKNVVRKSVTIESADDARKMLGYSSTVGIQVPRFEIEALTPGIPLVLRRVDLLFFSMGTSPGSPGFATRTTLQGEIRIEDSGIYWFETPNYSIWSGLAMRVECSRLWLRNCELFAADTLDRNGCIDIEDTRGASVLEFTGDDLLIEGSSLTAGSANFLFYSPCWGGAGQHPYGGRGGTALRAKTRSTILVATLLSDGNGGSVQAGPWTVPPSAGAAGQSTLSSPWGNTGCWASLVEFGRPGAIDLAAPDRRRGQKLPIGNPELQLQLVGSGRLGENLALQTRVADGQVTAVLLAVGLAPLATHFGMIAPDVSATLGVIPLLGSARFDLTLPSDPVFVDLILAAQIAEQGAPQLGNPAAIALRR